ncbi:TonB-dependent receptor [Sphingobacterium sp. JUb21]|nr:TonB-dependent receptor [Sphingobacterium sp. JUb21]TCR05558.1 TonB-linked SusC/RagA family outer membrane protein [Sphingobacterium sp. JUb20]
MYENLRPNLRPSTMGVAKILLVMKLIVVLMIAMVLRVNGSSFAQNVTLSERNAPLANILEKVRKQTGYDFLVTESMLINAKPVTINAKNEKVSTVLTKIFEHQNLNFKIKNSSIIVSSKSVTSEVEEIEKPVQDNLSGKVVDSKGMPITGATIKIKGGTQTAVSGEGGRFQLRTADKSATLIVSFVGYETQEVRATAANLTITMTQTMSGLDEVVVVGYGTQKKINLTGAVSSVGSEVLENRMITSLGAGLQGAVPNLNIGISNGRPGSGASFNIRGYTSLNGGGPLILVDGVQMDPNQLNPQDVQNVTVLKDAAASAIYGARAAYGVVLITTKNGNYNAGTRVNYSFNQGFSRPTTIPKTVNSLEYVDMYKYADLTGNLSGGGRGSEVWTDTDIEKMKEYMANPIPENAVYIDPSNPTRYRYVGNTDWWEEMFPGWAPMSEHNLGLTGGSEKIKYHTSLGYLNQGGLFKSANQKYKRYNVNMGLETKVTSWLDLNAKVRLNRKEDDKPARSAAIEGIFGDRIATDLRPNIPIRHPDGHYSGQGSTTNPFAMNEYNGRDTYQSDDIWLTGGFNIHPLKNFKVVGDLTWNSYNYNNKINTKSYDEYGAVPAGQDPTNPANAYLIGPYPHNRVPWVSESNSKDRYTAINIYAEYENTFAEKHYLKAMAGYNREEKIYSNFSARAKNLLNQDFPYLNLNNDDKPIVGSLPLDWALLGQFFRVNYIYDNRYLIEINGRHDGSSRFAADKRYVFSPSASIAWRLSNEEYLSFLKPTFNDLKIRASYGTLPNQSIDLNSNPTNGSLYPYIATMPYGTTNYIFGDANQSYITAPGLVSTLFTWEKVTSKNIGLDFALLDNKLSGSFDLYRRDTRDMLVGGQPLPAILGVGAPNRNAADLKTTGWEFEVKYNNKIDDFNYFVSFNMSDNKAKITKYDLNPTGELTSHYVGKQIDEIWGYTSNGLYQSDAEANDGLNKERLFSGTWLGGDVRFEDLNGDKKIDNGSNTLSNSGDMRIIGNQTARYSYGMRFGADYKNFDLSVFLQGVGRRDAVVGGTYFYAFGGGEWDVPTKNQMDFWTPENQDAYFPRLRFGGNGNTVTSTRYLQDASYMRIKNITIGYSVPSLILKRAKIEKIRLFFSGENLFTFTKMFDNFDPEQLDRTAYPLSKNISFGAQITF